MPVCFTRPCTSSRRRWLSRLAALRGARPHTADRGQAWRRRTARHRGQYGAGHHVRRRLLPVPAGQRGVAGQPGIDRAARAGAHRPGRRRTAPRHVPRPARPAHRASRPVGPANAPPAGDTGLSPVPHHLSPVPDHLSPVPDHLSPVPDHMSPLRSSICRGSRRYVHGRRGDKWFRRGDKWRQRSPVTVLKSPALAPDHIAATATWL
jgi:hypothetical protein